jgi:hypothetical protein
MRAIIAATAALFTLAGVAFAQANDDEDAAWEMGALGGVTRDSWTLAHADRQRAAFIENQPTNEGRWTVVFVDARNSTITTAEADVGCPPKIWSLGPSTVVNWTNGQSTNRPQIETRPIVPGSIGEKIYDLLCHVITDENGRTIYLPVYPNRERFEQTQP